jgi:hypothetical protein
MDKIVKLLKDTKETISFPSYAYIQFSKSTTNLLYPFNS